MPKSKLCAVAESAILQCVIYDSKSRKRSIVVYMCGDDMAWADDLVSLFDKDKRQVVPPWLKVQLKSAPEGLVRYNFRGEQLALVQDGVELRVPPGEPLGAKVKDTAPVLSFPAGTRIDDGEDAIKQA